jgi:hypothetical protein
MTADEIRAALRRNKKERRRAAAKVEETYTAFRRLVREGKQRRLGPSEMAELADVPRTRIYEALNEERGPRLAEASTYDSMRRQK